MPSEVFLQQPEVQDAHSDEMALHSISEPEGGEIEKGIEGGTDVKMDCKDKQNASQPVSQNLVNQNQACQTSKIEHAVMIKQDYGTELPLNDTKGDLGPGSKPQGELPCPHCERRFVSSQGLQRHIQTHAISTCHTQRFKCSRCRRTFSTLFSRRRHEKRHENRNRKTDDLTGVPCTASQNVPGSAEPLKTASQNPESNKCINAADGEQKDNKNSDVKSSYVCKYCKKAFSTYTSLRRHQRRIHEHHLLPRGVYKKVKIIEEPEGQQLVETVQDNHTAISQCAEDIDQEREYIVDISSNISENLSFYIDGKIVSTSAVSNCEVIEMNSGGSAVIGLNAVIISPAQITQTLKLETKSSSFTSDLSEHTSSSSWSSLTLSSTSGTPLVTAHLPQCIETFAFHKEKTIYLSPKLKQILRNQDGSKPAFALIADDHKLGPPISLTVLPATTTRFKRRTTSPPSSPQQTPDVNIEKQDQDSTNAKKSKLESHGLSLLGNEEPEPLNSPINSSDGAPMQQQILPLDCSVSRTGGNSCNQQPLDLSNSVVKRESSDALAESILDLSISGKSLDCDSAGVYLTQPALRKSKPNSSMLQKVLMNDYGGVDIPSAEAPATAGVLSVPDITNLAVVAVSDAGPPKPEKFLFELALPPASINPTPPLLAPVSIHPATPSKSYTDGTLTLTASTNVVEAESNENGQENIQSSDFSKQENKNFMCNVCEQPFQSMKILSQHVVEHSKEWPYKCEFCVQLFESDTGLLEHRSSYHGIGKIYVCKTCSKEFAFLCNLEQHQRDLHPGQECSHTEAVHGKLRPENHNSPKTDITDPGLPITEIKQESDNTTSKEEKDALDNTSEELFTTIKIMASGGVKSKGQDVRLGINQHYPSFKPPPFPYHNRTPTGTTAASATNFTTHNIPQTFSTAIRCTKCGKSFDNMPELHKHILACANASDKKRYTPKKNPIPLKQFAKAQNRVLSPARIVNSKQNLSQKVGQPRKMNFHESPVKIKMSILNKKKSQLVQRGRPAGGRKAFAHDDLGIFACPHCRREFTYNASLKKHVAFSCPMRPASRNSKKRTLSIVSAQENNGSLRRQLANLSAKPQGSDHGPKTITKNQIIKQNAAADTTQDFRFKRSTILSTSVVQSSKKGKPILKSGFMPQLASKQIVLSSVAQVNSQEPGVRVHALGRKLEQRVGDIKIQPRREDRLSLRLRERVGGPITRSVQQASTTVTVLKQPDSHNIIMRPVVLQVKK
uniref:PR domain zinc finger protein 2-like n=1 Tax=Sinocyclocheilus rhinocerous TaxID=307959 RepID=A0A673H7B7_9TELE